MYISSFEICNISYPIDIHCKCIIVNTVYITIKNMSKIIVSGNLLQKRQKLFWIRKIFSELYTYDDLESAAQ